MSTVRKAVIPVAGFGTRFLPATKATPKEMFPIVDKPLVQMVVEEAAESGIEEIIFITGQTKRAIEDHFDKSFELEYLLERSGKKESLASVRQIADLVDFAYVRQKEMLGLGDAVLQAKKLVNKEPFAIMLPDNVFSGNGPALQGLIKAYDELGTPIVGVKEVPREQTKLYGIVDGDEISPGRIRMRGTVEKPDPSKAPSRWASVGRYVMTPKVMELLDHTKPGKGGEIQLNDAIDELAGIEPVHASKIGGIYHDAGDKLGYLQAVVEYALERDDLGDDFRKFLTEKLKKS